jgi:hypothetical protein
MLEQLKHRIWIGVWLLAIAFVFVASASGCEVTEPQSSTYFERTINPILRTSCSRSNTSGGCHVADAKGNAFGNLDTTGFDTLSKRRDLLVDYGAYGQPAFLLKAIPSPTLELQAYDGTRQVLTTDVRHAGGTVFDPSSSAYQVVRRWLANGATRNNTGAAATRSVPTACNAAVPSQLGFNAGADPNAADFEEFKRGASGVIRSSCAAGNCHGSISNNLYFTCGDSPEQVRWNHRAASEYLGQEPAESELLRRPLAPALGGSYHEGGVIFASGDTADYQALKTWAIKHGPTVVPAQDAAFDYFAKRVQPLLVKKGCAMLQCHSASMFHDYRLRGGSGGTFSYSTTRKNYDLSLRQLALESDDVRVSRLVRKNLYRPEVRADGAGIAHRGGALFEDFGAANASPAACDGAVPALDVVNGPLDSLPAYCVMREWHRLERKKANVSIASRIAYIKRPVAVTPGRAQDFDEYQPGAELRSVEVVVPTLALGADEDWTTRCGLDKATADIGRPAVSWDAKWIAFAARSRASEPLAVYQISSNGTGCAKIGGLNGALPAQNGLLIHNFDPAFGPPNERGVSPIVFASTRGNLNATSYDYAGPQRTPANPAKLNANLYVFEPDAIDGVNGSVRQLTSLLNLERRPAFMSDGRVVFEAEKRAPNFYQLALRRINLDGGDYHPLFAQRGSIGYYQASAVVELADKNLAAIFSDPGVPFGGGQLGIINRSIGVDFTSLQKVDYALDSSVIDPNAPASPEPGFFLRSLRFPDPTVVGRAGPTTGLYATPAPLPDGRLLVSFGAAANATAFSGDYDVYALDPQNGSKSKLFGDAGFSETYATLVQARPNFGVFRSALDEANGHVTMLPGKPEADVTILDMPVLASLLFQNTPTGRRLERFADVEVLEDMPPPVETTTIDAAPPANVTTDAFGKLYVRRRPLGKLPVRTDGSARMQLPGGLPILLRLPETPESKAGKWPRTQRESMAFAPGEYAHQSFRRDLFNGLCASCHGSMSGRPLDTALLPDILTQASAVEAKSSAPTNLNLAPAARGPIEGSKAD